MISLKLLSYLGGVTFLQATDIANTVFEYGAFGAMMGVIFLLARLVDRKHSNGHMAKAAETITSAASSITSDAAGLHVSAQQVTLIEERLEAIEERVTGLEDRAA